MTNGSQFGAYDLYFVNSLQSQNWQWRRVYTGAQMDGSGQATFTLHQPDTNQGYFVLLSADDRSTDALGDGFKAWFNYGGRHMTIGVQDSDFDFMRDNWEVEYGLDPTDDGSINVRNGPSGNPDGDAYTNLVEFANYTGFDGSFDPLKFYCSTNSRPIVLISGHDSLPFCRQATFTISRYADSCADYSQPLTVYYSVGGSLSYDEGDYTLSPPPAEWPRIYSAVIPTNQQDLIITVTAASAVSNPVEFETLNVSLTPYNVSPLPQVSDPTRWNYVVDWQYNRATITYTHKPQADCQDVMTGTNTPFTFVLSGSDGCNERLAFALVPGSGPSHGTLGPITQIDDTNASVTYTPAAGYAGPDGFQFTVSNPLLSDPAQVTINAVRAPEVTTYCHTNEIAVHWTLPTNLPPDYVSAFRIYRCETGSGSCVPATPPAAPYATVTNARISTYLDTGVASGSTYCYRVTFTHQDMCPAATIYESPLSNISCSQTCTNRALLISANTAGGSRSAIDTYHFQSGGLVNSFTPDGGTNQNGRGLAIHDGEVFYTGLSNRLEQTDSIRVCPYGFAGSGGNDTRSLPNPRPGYSVQDLVFHGTNLYAMTGYLSGKQLEVFKLDPTSGTVLAGPIPIDSPATDEADGFAVLTNGNFLINNYDKSYIYHEYDRASGALVTGGTTIDLSALSTTSTGVALAPDGQWLYFTVGIDTTAWSLVQTDLAGQIVRVQPIADNQNEDIGVVIQY